MTTVLNRYNLGLFNSGTYTPAINNLSAVTQANPALITTSVAHNYVFGQQVQFFIPSQWGMRQLNGLKGYVLSVPAPTEFTVGIDASNFDAFVVPSTPTYVVIDPAQVAGIGDFNTGQSSPGGILPNPNTVLGALENQAP